ncbi:Hypothetical protein D9617_12g035210 [Elsinoe fawcettii]|nr:Hypothetical protein D9617_12g035210 [Elsinoe fawcettii]
MADYERAHRETWDDSELVDSWNAALEEYNKYHSIAAKGENIDDLIKQFNDEDAAKNRDPIQAEPQSVAAAEDDEYMPEADTTPATKLQRSTEPDAKARTNHYEPSNTNLDPAPARHGIPEAMLSSVQDENLRNLMMAWYHAGYYTGFFEGQRKSHTDIKAAGMIQR